MVILSSLLSWWEQLNNTHNLLTYGHVTILTTNRTSFSGPLQPIIISLSKTPIAMYKTRILRFYLFPYRQESRRYKANLLSVIFYCYIV